MGQATLSAEAILRPTFCAPAPASADPWPRAMTLVVALAAVPAFASEAAAQCTVLGPGEVKCGTNGTTNSQVFSPGSRIIRPQELTRFFEERREDEGRSAVTVARAFHGGGEPLAFLGLGASGPDVHLFGEGLFVWEDQEATETEIASDTDRRLVTVGVGWSAGRTSFAAAIDTLEQDTGFDGGSIDREELGLKVGGTVELRDGFFAFGGARIATIDVETRRRTDFVDEDFFPDPVRIGRGETGGQAYSVALGAGRVVALPGDWVLGTGASLTYYRETINRFTEVFPATSLSEEATSFTFEEQRRDSLLSRLEVEVARPLAAGRVVLLPSFRATYLHEFADDPRTIDVASSRFLNSLLGEGGVSEDAAFTLPTNDPDRDYFSLGVGIEARPSRGGWSFSADYRTFVGHSFQDQHSVAASVRLRF